MDIILCVLCLISGLGLGYNVGRASRAKATKNNPPMVAASSVLIARANKQIEVLTKTGELIQAANLMTLIESCKTREAVLAQLVPVLEDYQVNVHE